MAFMTSKKNMFYLILPVFLFVYLLPSFINERSHNILSVIKKSAIKQILSTKIWLYVFENVFRQVIFDFLFVVSLLLFL